VPKLSDGLDVARPLCFPPDLYRPALGESVMNLASHGGEEVEHVRQSILEGLFVESCRVWPEVFQHPACPFPDVPGLIQAHETVDYSARSRRRASSTAREGAMTDEDDPGKFKDIEWDDQNETEMTAALAKLRGMRLKADANLEPAIEAKDTRNTACA
jgi:hypothetical protein